MLYGMIFPGRYIQGAGALDRLPEEARRFGATAFVIAAPSAARDLLPHLAPAFAAAAVTTRLEPFGRECTDAEISRLTALAAGSDCVIGLGGGKTLDTAKAVAQARACPVIIVPTIASTDAPTSAVAVVYTAAGEFQREITLARNPDVVLVDSAVIARAPARFLISGMGDALATHFEAASCRQKHAKNFTGHHGPLTAYALARLCYDILLADGPAAALAAREHLVTPALEHVIEANTLLSGLGFESGGLAAAHSIHNGLTALPATHACYHGEKVAFGTLSSLFLTDQPQSLIATVYGFCETVGLPTTFAALGLAGVSAGELDRVAAKTCQPTEFIANEPVPVTPAMVVQAMKMADAYGRQRQKN